MPIAANKLLADARRRDRIADGDAARTYARTHDLSADWFYEMTKRLMIELERNIKAIEDASKSHNGILNETSAALERSERTLSRITNTRHGRAVLDQAEVESNDEIHLAELARRLNSFAAPERKTAVSEGDERS